MKATEGHGRRPVASGGERRLIHCQEWYNMSQLPRRGLHSEGLPHVLRDTVGSSYTEDSLIIGFIEVRVSIETSIRESSAVHMSNRTIWCCQSHTFLNTEVDLGGM